MINKFYKRAQCAKNVQGVPEFDRQFRMVDSGHQEDKIIIEHGVAKYVLWEKIAKIVMSVVTSNGTARYRNK